MNQDTLFRLEKSIRIEHPNYVAVFNEVLRVIQSGRSDELVCVLGPTGVGKTTIQHALLEYLDSQLASGWRPDYSPPIRIEAPAQYNSDFPWKIFLEDLLEKMGDLNPRNKLDLDDKKLKIKSRDYRNKMRYRSTIAGLEKAVRSRIEIFKPVGIFIDESQNMVEGLSIRQTKTNVNRLKNWTNTMDTHFFIFGTHETKPIYTLNEQLARRVRRIYFPRYRYWLEDELKNFIAFYKSIIEKLNLNVADSVENNFQFVVNHSLGCPGVLATWLHDAIIYCMANDKPKISLAVLKATRKDNDQLEVIERNIREFEQYLDSSQKEFDPSLLRSYGEQFDFDLSPKTDKKSKITTVYRKPGIQLPKRFPVKSNDD